MTMAKCEVTVICPTYNQKNYIRDALEGFVNQKTSFRYKVVVHDDASTDGTSNIIREYQNKYPELITSIIQEQNLYSHQISMFDYIKPLLEGKYVAFCEGDDYWTDENKLQMQYDFMEANPEYALCATSSIWYDEKKNVQTEQFIIDCDRDVKLEELIEEKNGRVFHYASVMELKEVYLDRPHWRKVLDLGVLSNSMCAAKVGKIRMLAPITNVYRYNSDNSWTVTMNKRKMIDFKEARIQVFKEYNQETNFLYNESIEYAINRDIAMICTLKHDLFGLIFGRGKEWFRSLSVKEKIYTIIRLVKNNVK